MVQWLGLCAFIARAWVQSLVRELRSHTSHSTAKHTYIYIHIYICIYIIPALQLPSNPCSLQLEKQFKQQQRPSKAKKKKVFNH